MKEVKSAVPSDLVPVDLNGDGKVDIYAPVPKAKSDLKAS